MSTAILDAGIDAPFRAELRKPLYNLSASSVSAAGFRFAAPLARHPRRKPPLQGARPRFCADSALFTVDTQSVHDMLCPSVPVVSATGSIGRASCRERVCPYVKIPVGDES